MMRNKVVFPEPDGPSNASNSPGRTSRAMLSRAWKFPKVLLIFLTSMLMRPFLVVGCSWKLSHGINRRMRRSRVRRDSMGGLGFHGGLEGQGDQREEREGGSDGERANEVVFVIEDFHM